MSDAVLIALITSITGIISGGMTLLFNWLIKKHIAKVNTKVDDYHAEINGRMGELIETTKALGAEQGKAQEKSDQAERDKK